MSRAKTQREKIVDFLSTGRQLTPGIAEGVLGVPFTTVTKRVHDLRNEGEEIYTNTIRLKGGSQRGERVTAYRQNV